MCERPHVLLWRVWHAESDTSWCNVLLFMAAAVEELDCSAVTCKTANIRGRRSTGRSIRAARIDQIGELEERVRDITWNETKTEKTTIQKVRECNSKWKTRPKRASVENNIEPGMMCKWPINPSFMRSLRWLMDITDLLQEQTHLYSYSLSTKLMQFKQTMMQWTSTRD